MSSRIAGEAPRCCQVGRSWTASTATVLGIWMHLEIVSIVASAGKDMFFARTLRKHGALSTPATSRAPKHTAAATSID